ncbi:MAG: hypothetical protein IJL82_02690 [Prevotella sp.]|jgi:hypothetical protein|nr:hypothetical protein [Prevotella sp.]
MKKVSKQLMAFYIAQIALALVVVVLFELDVLPVGVMADDKQSDFIFTALMEIVSLGAAFLGLRLFKFKAIHDDLVKRQEKAMWKWGMARLIILEAPMVIDTLLYYIYMNTTYGYLAIIMLLTLPFVFPSENRCIAETSEED